MRVRVRARVGFRVRVRIRVRVTIRFRVWVREFAGMVRVIVLRGWVIKEQVCVCLFVCAHTCVLTLEMEIQSGPYMVT